MERFWINSSIRSGNDGFTKKTIELASGITVENAYIKIDSEGGDKTSRTYSVVSFVDKAAADAKKSCLEPPEIYNYILNTSEGALNPIAQAYEDLKTKEKYKTAVDC